MFYKKLLLSFLLFLSLGTLFAEASDTEMLLRLDGHLNAIRREHQLSRQIGGGVLIGCGVIFAGSSFYFLSFSDDPENDKIIGGVFLGLGAGLGLGGALVLLIKTDYEYLPNEFNEMPEVTTEEIKAKIVKGEVYLSSLSTKAKNARYIGAGISAATGIAAIAYYLSLPVSLYDSYYRDTYLYEGITLLGSAAVSLLIKSRAEKEYEAYITWKKSQGIVKQDSTGKHRFFTPELVPLCGGIGISFSYN